MNEEMRMKEERLIKLERIFSFIFKIVLLLYLFFQSMVIFHRTVFVGIALWMLLVIGAVSCLLRLVTWQHFKKTGGSILLLLFLISYAIAILANMKYGINADAANLVILVLMIAIVYLQDSVRDKESIKKEMAFISKLYIFILDISVIVSLVMLVMAYGKIIYFVEDYQLNIGFVENRLWGVFTDPNVASVFSVVAIILALYFFKKDKKRVVYGFSIILLLFYIGVADSRTGALCLFFGIGFLTFIFAQNKVHTFKNKGIHFLACFILSLVVGVIVSCVPGALKEGYNAIVSIEEHGEDDDSREIKRDYDMSGDISNKRFAIWQSGFEIFSTKPLTGIGFHHLKEYAHEEVPDTYLAQEGVRFSHLHNELLNILVSQGIPGLIIVLLFAITSVVAIIKRYIYLQGDAFIEFSIMLACLLCICIGMMLQQGIFYFYMPINLLFWMFLGYMRMDSRNTNGVKEGKC